MRKNGHIAAIPATPAHKVSPSTAAVWRELRQGSGWCALCLLITAGTFVAVLKTQNPDPGALLERMFNVTMIVPALWGLTIGFAQMIRESRGDKWGFLAHRPASR